MKPIDVKTGGPFNLYLYHFKKWMFSFQETQKLTVNGLVTVMRVSKCWLASLCFCFCFFSPLTWYNMRHIGS